jgi:hypothetical protein
MNRTIQAEYIAEERVLKLARPLEGVHDHQVVSVTVDSKVAADHCEWPVLREEAASELAKAVRDAFGRDEIAI